MVAKHTRKSGSTKKRGKSSYSTSKEGSSKDDGNYPDDDHNNDYSSNEGSAYEENYDGGDPYSSGSEKDSDNYPDDDYNDGDSSKEGSVDEEDYDGGDPYSSGSEKDSDNYPDDDHNNDYSSNEGSAYEENYDGDDPYSSGSEKDDNTVGSETIPGHPMESELYMNTDNNPVTYANTIGAQKIGTPKYKPDELAETFNKFYWKYRKKTGMIPLKQRKILRKIESSMGNFPGSALCGLTSWLYLGRLMNMKTVGVAKVIGKYSFAKLQQRYPNSSKWIDVFDRKKMPKLPASVIKTSLTSVNKNPRRLLDYFEMLNGQWNAKIKTATGFKNVHMRMFDLIRFTGSGYLHYIVWLGGSDPQKPLVIDCLPSKNKLRTVLSAVSGNLKILRITRSEAIEKALKNTRAVKVTQKSITKP